MVKSLAVRIASELVARPSVNPMGRPFQAATMGEARVADYLVSLFHRAKMDVVRQTVLPGRSNVIARLLAGRDKPTLLLESHMDTVAVEGMAAPFTPRLSGGRLFGRGACDAKGPLACLVSAVIEASRTPRSLTHNVVVVAGVDEEYQFSGARLAARLVKADYGLTAEPTGFRIVRAHKGVMRWRVRAEGRAAHSAFPERGLNAIVRMADAVQALERHHRALGRSRRHPALGTGTLSVTVIQGGDAVNVIPRLCTAEVDRRLLPSETPGQAWRAARAAVKAAGVEFDPPHVAVGGLDIPLDMPLLSRLRAGCRKARRAAPAAAAPYATTAPWYARAGIPTVVWGPGDIALAHTAHESIEVSQLNAAVEALKTLLTSPAPRPRAAR